MTAKEEKIFFEYLRKIKFFSTLGDAVIVKFVNELESIDLNQGQVLFSQGDTSDSLYILVSGKLLASLNTPRGDVKIIGVIDPGETVGELGAISNQPRTLTIRAIEDCKLFKLSKDKFKELAQNYPELLYEMVNFLVSRSQQLIQLLSEKSYRHIAIMPANDEVDYQSFIDMIKIQSERISETSFLIIESEYDSEKLDKLYEIIVESEFQQKGIIFILSNPKTKFSDVCIHKSNTLIIVNEEKEECKHYFDFYLSQIMNSHIKLNDIHLELLLLHKEKKKYYLNTKEWIDNYPFYMCHHLAMHSSEDIERIVRVITGTATGLVLGGGGAKAWAQVGALKALLEKKIALDAIGGTSAGALIGALTIISEDFEDLINKVLSLNHKIQKPFSINNLTIPIISILSGEHGTKIIEEIFGDIQIEDLSIPYFAVSSNLSTYQAAVHRFGPLWEKVRASVSLPGLIPPVVINGELHFDGGLLNNLPVDIMKEGMLYSGRIIAITLSDQGRSNEPPVKYDFPPSLPLGKSILIALGLSAQEYTFPPFFDTFFSSMLLGANNQEYMNSLLADVLISPPLKNLTMLSLEQNQIEVAMQTGYEEASAQLSAIPDLAKIGSDILNLKRASTFLRFLKYINVR